MNVVNSNGKTLFRILKNILIIGRIRCPAFLLQVSVNGLFKDHEPGKLVIFA